MKVLQAVRRACWFVLILGVLFSSGAVFARGKVPSIFVTATIYHTGTGPYKGIGITPELACYNYYNNMGYTSPDFTADPHPSFCNVIRYGMTYDFQYTVPVDSTEEKCGLHAGTLPMGGKCQCESGYEPNKPSGTGCVAYNRTPPQPGPNMCLAENAPPPADGLLTKRPINPATGEKILHEDDFVDDKPHALNFSRTYRSGWLLGDDREYPHAGFDTNWSHNHNVRVIPDGTLTQVIYGNGQISSFENWGGGWTSANRADSLSWNSGTAEWTFKDNGSGTTWIFGSDGKPKTATERNGWVRTYGYSTSGTSSSVAPVPGLLISVTNHFGRVLSIRYDSASRIKDVTMPTGRVRYYAYNYYNMLQDVYWTWPLAISYVYENTGKPNLITGMYHYYGRYATYTFDSSNRYTNSTLAGGADQYSVDYSSSSRVVTDPLGNAVTYSYGSNRGNLVVTGSTGPSSRGLHDAASRTQGSDGLVTSETDFLGFVTSTSWDSTRQLPLSITRAYGETEAQTVSTQWHATMNLPTLITEPGRTTAYTYDGAGNKLSETVTDVTTSVARTTQWTYNTSSLPATMTDPKGGVWEYTYDSVGSLISVKNPLNHITQYTYDASYGGRLSQVTAPNGLVTQYGYDDKWRMTSINRGGETTSFSYTALDLINTITFPHAYTISIGYDNAKRVTALSDNRGNSIDYTLDAFGNRTAETVKDSGNNIVKALTRVVNAVNRISQVKNSANQATTLAYDANGEFTGETDPLSHSTTQTLDGLRRPVATTFADSASAAQGWNGLNQLISATDPKGVQTTYSRNAFGEVVAETSPDSGSITYVRDALGHVTQRTDANGNVTTWTRDAIGRPTTVQYSASHIVSYTYDATPMLGVNQTGYLSSFADPSGSTTYERDLHGRITKRTQTVNDNPSSPSSFEVVYYYYRGLLSEVVYPSGLWIHYPQNSTGQILHVNVWNPSSHVWQSIVDTIVWTPLGQPKSWNWFNGDTASRTFDADGRMTANEFASYTWDAANRITAVTQSVSASATTTGAAPYSGNTMTWSVGYDVRDRVTSFTRAGAGSSYTYDANSNRLTAVTATTRDTDLDSDLDAADYTRTISHSLNIGSGSNQLLGFTQNVTRVQGTSTLSTSNSTVSYTVDSAGNLTSDGLRTFEYDAANRLSKARIFKDGEAMSINYLHNALGQRVFKGEVQADQYLPDETTLGESFIDWLRRRFKWMFESQQASTSIGTAFVYADADSTLPEWAVLGSYDNGSASGTGRSEYVWLPLPDGGAIPLVMYRSGQRYAIHPDHLGTPRLMTDSSRVPVWQWPYSAFGQNRPVGILVPTTDPMQATTIAPTLMKANTPTVTLDLRFPGQMTDTETGMFYNYHRSYIASQGRYSQFDPIGLAGGLNGYTYADNSPLTIIDPLGLMSQGSGANGGKPTWGKGGPNTVARPLTFSAFGCMGLMCASGGMHNDGPQFSAELTFGGGVEICEPPPPPPPEPESCRRNDGSGFYGGPGKAQVQPPGIPVPKRFGGAFFGPAWKANGQFCLRVGPHGSVPFVPSLDLPSPRS